ncbi:MAG TPA: ABC transporter substrate-binding protein [Bacillota bacterium]|nr:ABC transporter substrate-binding protein [Bacillota bacterium]
MKLRRFLLPVAICLILAMTCGIVTAQQKVKWEPYGPQVDQIIMPIIKDSEAQLIAFMRGDVDVYPGLTRPEDLNKVKANPNAEITMNYGFHMFYLCYNMRREPLNSDVLRQAIAHVIDRDNIIQTLFEGYMLPLAAFLPPSSGYYKEDVPRFEYNPEEAKKLLDKAGYTVDPATGIRIDPKTGKPLRKMTIYTPTYEVAPTSAELGKIISEACQAINLPIEPEPMDFPVMLDKLDRAEFDMYMLAWGLSRLPTSLYSFFHSSQDIEAGYNRPGIRDPELDKLLEELYYAPNEEAAKKAADEAQVILAMKQPYTVLYSRPYMDAFRKDRFTGYVPMHGYGAANYQNKWTTLNIRPTKGKGGTVRWLLPEEPKVLNPCTASSAYEWEVLGRLYDGLIEVDPETMEDIPWMAKSWEVSTWEPEPGKKGTVVTWNLEKGIKWQDTTPFTSRDIKFTIEYLRDNKVPRYIDSVEHIVKVETPDDYTAKVYFANESYWHLYRAGECFLPEWIWKDVKDYKTFEPWLEPHPSVKGLTKVIGHGPFILDQYKVGEYVRLKKNPIYWRLKK